MRNYEKFHMKSENGIIRCSIYTTYIIEIEHDICFGDARTIEFSNKKK